MKTFVITGYEKIEKGFDHNNQECPITFHGPETMQVSDGFHTLDEVYSHRISLFMALCRMQSRFNQLAEAQGLVAPLRAWKSRHHHPEDQKMYDGWFVMGIGEREGEQISYHLPVDLWNVCDFAMEFVHAPKWDGHTPADVLERLKTL